MCRHGDGRRAVPQRQAVVPALPGPAGTPIRTAPKVSDGGTARHGVIRRPRENCWAARMSRARSRGDRTPRTGHLDQPDGVMPVPGVFRRV
jgi:hypothetical protein